jgi:tetratricopeptide (TPR) repeat protein
MGDYTASVKDYEYFLKFDPHDWAGMNDEAWVLLKAKRYTDALKIIDSGLVDDPSNPWLLNSRATALYELGRYREALLAVQAASAAVASLTPAQWSHAYPGNDPMIASQGVTSFKAAIAQNIHSIEQALPSSTVQSK